MKKNIYKILIPIFVLGALFSCEQESEDPGQTEVMQISGEWYIQYYVETAAGSGEFTNPGWGYYKVITSNTAANSATEMLIDDQDGWATMYKVVVDGLNFSATETEELVASTDPVTVTNGVVILDGGLSTSGVRTDSISFEFVQPTADPTVYRAAGVRRTGFLEDEH
ncbi:MAG: hypothetical protein OCD76_06000 [Reichenbachiella sp.]